MSSSTSITRPEGPRPPLVLTSGDPAGIGPEILVQAYAREPALMRGSFVAGDPSVLRQASRMLAGVRSHGLPVAVLETAEQAWAAPVGSIPVLPVAHLSEPVTWGQVSAAAGRLAGECVVWAARAALRGEVSAVVTAPLNKEALSEAGPPWDGFPGHTELLQAEAAAHAGVDVKHCPVRMMLANEELRTVLVSIHVSLREAIAAVQFDRVLETLEIAHGALSSALGRAPRIGVAGLNPHAGENGLFGTEELEVIAPAVREARARGIDVEGPLPPDTVFMRARSTPVRPGAYDVVIAMYHDQGLIPVKYLGVEQGVNVTLGLPFVRTSPDHGTAFDIAGQGIADPSSLLAAVRMARRLAGAS